MAKWHLEQHMESLWKISMERSEISDRLQLYNRWRHLGKETDLQWLGISWPLNICCQRPPCNGKREQDSCGHTISENLCKILLIRFILNFLFHSCAQLFFPVIFVSTEFLGLARFSTGNCLHDCFCCPWFHIRRDSGKTLNLAKIVRRHELTGQNCQKD